MIIQNKFKVVKSHIYSNTDIFTTLLITNISYPQYSTFEHIAILKILQGIIFVHYTKLERETLFLICKAGVMLLSIVS